jgi:hypothetical protein
MLAAHEVPGIDLMINSARAAIRQELQANRSESKQVAHSNSEVVISQAQTLARGKCAEPHAGFGRNGSNASGKFRVIMLKRGTNARHLDTHRSIGEQLLHLTTLFLGQG